MKIIKRVLVVAILALLAAVATLYWLGTRDHVPAGPQAAPATGSADELVEQGRYL
ncbi:cytochrome C [Bordetella pertussis]|nr:hypothetical protein L569_3581 [Bordetella pertussis 2250905]CFM34191.1 cytochrome C [Bordetella pertussis]CFM36710.1 cytochrome C [Bordetella pertussis]CFM99790.1 cytochrome C [Bordetella pertussis]CFN80031.1 cytochrome C [Bordetella pertussis]